MINTLFSTFILVFLPILAGLIIISPYFPNNTVKIRRFAKGFGSLFLAYAAMFLLLLNPNGLGFAFNSKLPFDIIPNLNATFSFALDEFSALMCTLTAFIGLLALFVSKTAVNTKQKFYYSLMLILEGAAIGIFAADNLFTFLTFWLLEIIPMYFLISMWGGNAAKKSAVKYSLSVFAGSIFLLVAIGLTCAFCTDIGIQSDFSSLVQKHESFPILMEFITAICLFIAFAVKMPIFPFHTALLEAQSEANTPVSIFLAAISTAGGAYGLIRIELQMFYEIFQILAPFLMFLGALSILWCAFLSIRENDLKKLIGTVSCSFGGIILLGTASFTEFGLKGAIVQIIAHALIFAGLFVGAEIIYSKFKTKKLPLLGGAAQCFPNIGAFMLVLCLCLAPIPFTMGFFGNLTSLIGAFSSPLADKNYFMTHFIQYSAALGLLGLFICFLGLAKALCKTFLGTLDTVNFKDKTPASRHQIAVLFIVCAALIIFGFYPMGIIDKIQTFTSINTAFIIANIF